MYNINRVRALNTIKLFGQTIVVLSSVFWLTVIIFGIICALPIAQIIIGNMYKDVCPINHFIPICLIVLGEVGLVMIVNQILMVSILFISLI